MNHNNRFYLAQRDVEYRILCEGANARTRGNALDIKSLNDLVRRIENDNIIPVNKQHEFAERYEGVLLGKTIHFPKVETTLSNIFNLYNDIWDDEYHREKILRRLTHLSKKCRVYKRGYRILQFQNAAFFRETVDISQYRKHLSLLRLVWYLDNGFIDPFFLTAYIQYFVGDHREDETGSKNDKKRLLDSIENIEPIEQDGITWMAFRVADNTPIWHVVLHQTTAPDLQLVHNAEIATAYTKLIEVSRFAKNPLLRGRMKVPRTVGLLLLSEAIAYLATLNAQTLILVDVDTRVALQSIRSMALPHEIADNGSCIGADNLGLLALRYVKSFVGGYHNNNHTRLVGLTSFELGAWMKDNAWFTEIIRKTMDGNIFSRFALAKQLMYNLGRQNHSSVMRFHTKPIEQYKRSNRKTADQLYITQHPDVMAEFDEDTNKWCMTYAGNGKLQNWSFQRSLAFMPLIMDGIRKNRTPWTILRKGILSGFETRKAVSLISINKLREMWAIQLFAFGVGTGGNRLIGGLVDSLAGLGLQDVEIFDPDHVSLENQHQGFDFTSAISQVSKAVVTGVNLVERAGPSITIKAHVEGVGTQEIERLKDRIENSIQDAFNREKIPLVILSEMIDVTTVTPILSKVQIYKLAHDLSAKYQLPILVATGLDAGVETTGSGVFIFTGADGERIHTKMFGNIQEQIRAGTAYLYPPIAFLLPEIEILLGKYGVSPEAAIYFRHEGGLENFPQTVHASSTHQKDIIGMMLQLITLLHITAEQQDITDINNRREWLQSVRNKSQSVLNAREEYGVLIMTNKPDKSVYLKWLGTKTYLDPSMHLLTTLEHIYHYNKTNMWGRFIFTYSAFDMFTRL